MLIVLIVLIILIALDSCSGASEERGTGMEVGLLGGGGASLVSPRATERDFRELEYVKPGPTIQFAVADDGALWAVIAAPGAEMSYSPKTRTSAETLVRVDKDGAVRDVGFGFIDPSSMPGGFPDEEVLILSGPVSDGAGGVAVVVGPGLRPGPGSDWARVYRVDQRGQVSPIPTIPGYEPVGVGPSAAGGFLVHARSSTVSDCARIFHIDAEGGGDPAPVLGDDCSVRSPAGVDLDVARMQPVAPLSVRLTRTTVESIRAGLLPDGRLVVRDATQGILVQHRVSGSLDAVTGTYRATSNLQKLWTVWTVDKPFTSLGEATDVGLGSVDLAVSPDGKVLVLLADHSTPQLASDAFRFDIRGAPEENRSQEILDAAAMRTDRGSSAPTPAPGRTRGTGVVIIDLAGPSAEIPEVRLVAGTGQPCDWREPTELVCAVVDSVPYDTPNVSAASRDSAVFFTLKLPSSDT